MSAARAVGQHVGSHVGRHVGETKDPIAALRALPSVAGGSVFRFGEYYVRDPFTDLYMGAVDDLDPTHLVRQTDPTRQPAIPDAEALVLGRPVLRLRGQGWLDSTRAASAWKHLHDGSGGAWRHYFIPRGATLNGGINCLHATINYLGASQRGTAHQIIDQNGGTNERTSAWVFGGSPSNLSSTTTALAANVDKDVPTKVGWGYKEGDSPEWVKYERNAIAASGNNANTPYALNPSFTLRIGAHHLGAIDAHPAYADLVASIFSTPGMVFSAADIAGMDAWALQRYGIT